MSLLKLSAKLDRTDGGTSWGFRMAGGKDFGAPLVLQKVAPGSLAAKCGLQEGDVITRISGAPTDHLRHKEAQQRIIDSGNSLELTLERSGGGSGGHATHHVDSPSFGSSSFPSSQPSYNIAPKPFSNNSVSSLTSQTASLSIGSSTMHVDDDNNNDETVHVDITNTFNDNIISTSPSIAASPPALPLGSPPPLVDIIDGKISTLADDPSSVNDTSLVSENVPDPKTDESSSSSVSLQPILHLSESSEMELKTNSPETFPSIAEDNSIISNSPSPLRGPSDRVEETPSPAAEKSAPPQAPPRKSRNKDTDSKLNQSNQSSSFKQLQNVLDNNKDVTKIVPRTASPTLPAASPKPKILGAKPTLNKDGKIIDTKPAVKPAVTQVKPQYNSSAGLYSAEAKLQIVPSVEGKTQSVPPVIADSGQNKFDNLEDSKNTSALVETSIGGPEIMEILPSATIVIPTDKMRSSRQQSQSSDQIPVPQPLVQQPVQHLEIIEEPSDRKKIIVPSSKTIVLATAVSEDSDLTSTDPPANQDLNMPDPSVARKTIVVPSSKVVKITTSVLSEQNLTSTNPPAGRDQEICEAPMERKKIVVPSPKTSKLVASKTSELDNVDKSVSQEPKITYQPSETCRLVQEIDSGEAGRVQLQINPKTGKQIKNNQSKTLVNLEKNLSQSGPSGSSGYGAPAVPAPLGGGGGGAPPPGWRPQIPTGPRTPKVGRAGEAKTLPATIGSARIPVCSGCGTAIRGPFISALDKTWCPDHFTCANPSCRTPLINIGFVEEEGQLYCEGDYEKYFAPRCGKCGRAIVGEVVTAAKQTYHTGCFVCTKCKQPIVGGSFRVENDEPYCDKDWGLMFQTKCYGCQFPIEPGDRWVEALSNNWHSECFNCSTCQVSLEGQSFVAKNGKPYCKKHSGGARY